MPLWKKLAIVIAVLVAISIVSNFLNTDNHSGRLKEKLNMAYIVARRTLKEGLKDPHSYDELNHKEYYEAGADSAKNNIQVLIKYRAKNSLGGFVVQKRAFNFDSTGTIVDSYLAD